MNSLDTKPRTSEIEPAYSVPAMPTGPAGAALISAGVGCALIGGLSKAAEIPRMAKALSWYSPAGALSGESLAAIAVWLLTWAVLYQRWKTQDKPMRTCVFSAVLLLALGLVLTFPS